MNRLKAVTIVVAMLAALSLATTRGFAAEDFDVDKAIATAKTAADHEAIAAYFDKEATEATAKAENHSQMGESYKKLGGAAIAKWHMDRHCDAFTKSYMRAAKEAKELAATHRAMAKLAEKKE